MLIVIQKYLFQLIQQLFGINYVKYELFQKPNDFNFLEKQNKQQPIFIGDYKTEQNHNCKFQIYGNLLILQSSRKIKIILFSPLCDRQQAI